MMKKLLNIILFVLLLTGFANAQEFILRGTNNQSGMEHDLGPNDSINKSTFVQLVVTDSAFIDTLETNVSIGASVYTDSIVATNAIFDTLYVDSAFIDTLGVTYIIGETGHVTDSMYIETLIFTELYGFFMWAASFLFAESSSFVLLDADTADIRELVVVHLVVDSGYIMTLISDSAYIDSLYAGNLVVNDSAFIDTLTANIVTTTININNPSTTQTYIASNTITVTNSLMRVAGNGGAVILTSTPTIADAVDATEVVIAGTSDVNKLKLQDESNLANSGLQMSGGQDMDLGKGDRIKFTYNANDDDWYEDWRSDN